MCRILFYLKVVLPQSYPKLSYHYWFLVPSRHIYWARQVMSNNTCHGSICFHLYSYVHATLFPTAFDDFILPKLQPHFSPSFLRSLRLLPYWPSWGSLRFHQLLPSLGLAQTTTQARPSLTKCQNFVSFFTWRTTFIQLPFHFLCVKLSCGIISLRCCYFSFLAHRTVPERMGAPTAAEWIQRNCWLHRLTAYMVKTEAPLSLLLSLCLYFQWTH